MHKIITIIFINQALRLRSILYGLTSPRHTDNKEDHTRPLKCSCPNIRTAILSYLNMLRIAVKRGRG